MPDITLLAPIARLFHISIDTLLAFQSELTIFAEFYDRNQSGSGAGLTDNLEGKVLRVMHQAISQDKRYEAIRSTQTYQRGMEKLEQYL